jgi:hypothetical protein
LIGECRRQEDLLRSGGFTQPGGHIHGISHNRILDPSATPDVSGKDFTVAQPKASRDAFTFCGSTHQAHLPPDGTRRRKGAVGGIGTGDRCTPYREEPITDELVERSVLLENDLSDDCEVLAE